MPDTSAAIEALPSGLRLSEWIEAAPIGKTATYELMRALGITPAKARFPGSAAAVSMLTGEQVALMDRAAEQVAAGRSIAELSAITAQPRTTANDHGEALAPDAHAIGADALLARLEAAERAIASGLPLTTAEVSWILGARPGTSVVVRGRITATRHGRNVWSLSRAEN
jgi:hypothetical protein